MYSQIKLLFTFTSVFCSQCLTDQNILKSFTIQSPAWATGSVSPYVSPNLSWSLPLLYRCWHKENWELFLLNSIFWVWVLWGFVLVSFSSRWMLCTWSSPPQYSHWYWHREHSSNTHLEVELLLLAATQTESSEGDPEIVWAPQGVLPLQIWCSNTYKANSSYTSAVPHHGTRLQLRTPTPCLTFSI